MRVGRPVAETRGKNLMQHQIKGSVLQVLEVELDPGESVLSEASEFSWMTDSVQMTTDMGAGAGGKGLLGAVKRVAGGGTFLFNTFTAEGAPGMVAFAAKLPGTCLLYTSRCV